MKKFFFKVTKVDGAARCGKIVTSHGTIDTPVFIPVGTRGTVKTMSPRELEEIGVQILLGNTYHLFLKPGDGLIADMGGLHQFMGWSRPILTDSGGYQVFSLSHKTKEPLIRISEEGVYFRSVYDGSWHLFTPEKVIDIQNNLGSDIMMPLDVCPSALAKKAEIKRAVEITSLWFARAYKHYKKTKSENALFAIIQGGVHKDLRSTSFKAIFAYGPDGFAIGGVANAGESKIKQRKALDATIPLIPKEKLRYLMGVGEPEDIIMGVERGVDMFDCVTPTRLARNGTVYTSKGKLNLNNAKHKNDPRPIEEGCQCYACNNFTRAYVRHLLNTGEVLGIRLTTIHNLFFIENLMRKIRAAITKNKYESFKDNFLKHYLD